MAINDTDYDEDLYTDTSMFDADEIVRSVEEVAQSKKEAARNLSARRRFEAMMEDRKLALELEDSYDEEWDDSDEAWDEDKW
ncbi:MAG: hypothetical protein KJO35_01450 [Gammaproteobacteria bacterium]|nr:hypothetical protein [Gammaproteobacteria bacterium]